jgi:twitching motility protein PilT
MHQLKAPEQEILQLLQFVRENNGSDLHLKVGYPPFVRIGGHLRKVDSAPLTDSAFIESMIVPFIPKGLAADYENQGGVDFAIKTEEGDRFRVNAFRSGREMHVALRRIQDKIPTFESLHLPPVYEEMLLHTYVGLILVSGVTGSGKSSTLAAMVNHINHHRDMHIITIEDPVEYVFQARKSIISQREIGIDVPDFPQALRNVVRQDPDCILIGELRDKETMLAALQAAETGHLVLASIHSADVQLTFARILEFFPREEHTFIRSSLSASLRAIMSQRLLPGIEPNSRYPATEVLLGNPLVRHKIVEEEDDDFPAILIACHDEGMRCYNRSLCQLVQENKVSREDAMEIAPNREALVSMIKGIDTFEGLVSRLKK